MTNEVQAAAERLRQMRADSNDHDGGYPATVAGRTQSLFDHAAIAAWALPLLDSTAIDEAWLRSVGFEVEYDDLRDREFRFQLDDDRWIAAFAPSDLLGYSLRIEGNASYALLADYSTRGQLRLLALALGIELNEPH